MQSKRESGAATAGSRLRVPLALTDVAVRPTAQGLFAAPGRHSHTVDDGCGPELDAPVAAVLELDELELTDCVAAGLLLALHPVTNTTRTTATASADTGGLGRRRLRV